MSGLAEFALYIGISAGIVNVAMCVIVFSRFIRTQIRKRKRNPVRVLLPRKRYYGDDLPPGSTRIDSWEDLRHITRH